MKRMNANELLGLHSRGEGLRAPMDSLFDELAEYITPARTGFTGPRADGEKRTNKLWDGTAPQANSDLAHYLSAGLTPSSSPWMQFEFREKELNDSDAAKEWIQACAEIVQAELTRSNFYETMGEFYNDLPVFGLATIDCDEKKNQIGDFVGLHFECVWLKELTLLPDEYGEFTLSFRCYEMAAIQWVSLFGKDAGAKLTELAEQKPEAKVKFLHCIYPRNREDIDHEGVEKGLADPMKMPFASVWVNCMEKEIVRESGYMELKRYTTRWAKMSGSIWSDSPGLQALPDIRTINEAKRMELLAWERSIDRPMKTQVNNVVGKLDIGARGLTVMRDINATAPLFDATDFNLTAVKVEDLRASILRTFFADLIREPTDIPGSPTAYEVAKRLERAQRILGEAVGHLRGMLKWIAERSFMILLRNEKLPPIPQELMQLQKKPNIDVRYTSPLQASQQAQGLEQTMLFLGDLQALSAIDPTVFDWVDFDGLVKDQARRRSVPATGLRDQAAVDQLREERSAKQAEAEAAAKAMAGSEVIKNIGAGAGQEKAATVLRSVTGG